MIWLKLQVWVAEQIGLKKRDYREKTNLDGNAELKDIKKLRQGVNLLTKHSKWELGSKKKQKKLYEKYRVKRKGLKTVIKELKGC